ncbi:MAG: ABC transporter ATP-binding protein [Bacteroidota bacterium]
MSILSVKNLSKTYQQFKALDNLSFDVQPGQIYGLLGPNGAGKSTTMRCLLTLIKPDAGDISYFSKKLNEHRREILNKVGYLIEKPDFYNYLSAYNNLKLLSKYSTNKIEDKTIHSLIEKVGLKGRENDAVKKYSHGMKQRLGLAQVLLNNPDLIILDEPNTGLDPQGIVELRNFIFDLKNEGKTVILSSHILNEIEQLADSMIIINKGKSIIQGTKEELLGENNLHVKIEVEHSTPIEKIVQNTHWQNKYKGTNDTTVSFDIEKKEIPHLVSFLSDNEIGIVAVSYRKKLEELYMSLTQISNA